MRKIFYIVLDGLGGLPNPQMDGKTALEAAATPNMDGLAQRGVCGMVYTVGRGIAPESDIAVISILGYEAKKFYTGRGPLECHAEGLKVEDGDLAFRVNFATAGEGNHILDRRVGRDLSTQEATELAEEIKRNVGLTSFPASFEFKNTIGHRGVLVIHPLKGRLSGEVSNTDPAYEKEGPFGVARAKFEMRVLECRPTPGHQDDESAITAAKLANEFTQKSRRVLEDCEVNKKRRQIGRLPANLILARDGGDRLPEFPPIHKKFGTRFGCFVEMPVEKGIALLTGMEVVELPQPTKDPQIDYPIRAQKALEAIGDFDGLYIHLKGPDEPAHDGDAAGKKASIEAIDKFFFGRLLPHLNLSETIIAVTGDHSTPCIRKAHTDDPVPILIAGGDIRPDGTKDFSESSCKEGGLGEMLGIEIMEKLTKLAGSQGEP